MTGTPPDQSSKSDGPPQVASGGTPIGEFAGLAFQFAVAVLVCVYVGQWADTKLGTAPWLLIMGVFGGASLSFYSMYRALAAVQARDDAARQAKRTDKHED